MNLLYKKKQQLLVLALSIFYLMPLFSQSILLTDSELETYWFLRERLVNQFLMIGPNPGQSEVASYRNAHSETSKIIHWGDSGISMGWYLGVLATENKLLRDNNEVEALKRNTTELYYALQAVIRRDEQANCNWPYSINNAVPCERDGFFLRDFVGPDFLDDPEVYDHFNRYNARYGHAEVDTAASDFARTVQMSLLPIPAEDDDDYDEWYVHSTTNEMSQDQIYHLLMGLSLVTKMTNNQPFVLDIDGNPVTDEFTNFVTLASDYIELLAQRLDDDNWKIERPDGGLFNGPVRRGHNLFALAEGMNHAVWYAVYSHFDDNIGLIMRETWQNLKHFEVSEALTTDNRHMTLMLAALGNSWKQGLLNTNVTENRIRQIGFEGQFNQPFNFWEKFYLLLWSVSTEHEFEESASEGAVEFAAWDLSTFPCEGNSYFGDGTQGPHGWNTTFRYFKKREQQVNGNDYVHGHYSGLDYMLLHNLVLIYQDMYNAPSYVDYEDKVERCFTETLATNASDNPEVVFGFSNLKVSAVVEPEVEVEFKAPEYILFTPDFEAQNGSFVEAYIGEISCDVNSNYRSNGFVEELEAPSEELTTTSQIHVSPNPSSGNFFIRFDSFEKVSDIQIYNHLGKALKQGIIINSDDQIQVDLSPYAPGVYYIMFQLDGKTISKKLTKI